MKNSFTIKSSILISLTVFAIVFSAFKWMDKKTPAFFKASDENFQYVGRIDFSNANLPRFWAPGVYINARFKGNFCEIEINDEELYGKNHNYISIVVDNGPIKRIKLTGKKNIIRVADQLADTEHTIIIIKDTESNIGHLEFVGMRCEELLKPAPRPARKMEFIGDSITCGMGSDVTELACDSAEWYDQHNAYLSYGALTARALKADWQLTAVSGIGLVHSCCELKYTMPDVVDKINLRDNLLNWDFKQYQPDVLVICLGQNDGIQEAQLFTAAYAKLLQRLRVHYPKATIVCVTSPMADEKLATAQKAYLKTIKAAAKARGDLGIATYAFSKQYHGGCGSHPDLKDHAQMSVELANYVKKVKNW